MSRFAFISDVHGNLSALESVLIDIEQQDVDKIYCLGDLVGYYSRINEVIDLVKAKDISCIVGNHDYALLYDDGIIPRSKTCTNVLVRQLGYINEDNIEFLRALPDCMVIQDSSFKILAVHGGLINHIDEYIEAEDNYFSSLDDSFTHVITAHNHIPTVKKLSRIVYVNSGSVGQPRDNNPQSSYLIYDDGECIIRRVSYNIDETVNRMQIDGFPEYIAEVLYCGCRIGG